MAEELLISLKGTECNKGAVVMLKTHLLDCFEHTIDNKTDSIAVRHNDNEISFRELKEQAQKVGSLLMGITGATVNTPIAVFFSF